MLWAHGSALAVELKQDVKAQPLDQQPQTQALREARHDRKELKTDRKERRESKTESQVTS